ncbi:hypothetical protein KC19_6G098500 [Ceratodon purpureus]|uniref:Uncharacterized protein n=1 Tax=Ceratodon purpureus TaxID=3225 RepID=A0A8T0HDE1_CERPU|nr:hypothetical protein KC19_6G098500 [Ceratodon purpureus]
MERVKEMCGGDESKATEKYGPERFCFATPLRHVPSRSPTPHRLFMGKLKSDNGLCFLVLLWSLCLSAIGLLLGMVLESGRNWLGFERGRAVEVAADNLSLVASETDNCNT